MRDEGLDPANFSCPITELIVGAQSNGEWKTTLPGVWRVSAMVTACLFLWTSKCTTIGYA